MHHEDSWTHDQNKINHDSMIKQRWYQLNEIHIITCIIRTLKQSSRSTKYISEAYDQRIDTNEVKQVKEHVS